MFQKLIDLVYKVWPELALRLWYWRNVRLIEKEFKLLDQTRRERMLEAETKLSSLVEEAYERERSEQQDS